MASEEIQRNYINVIGEQSVIKIANHRYKKGKAHPFFCDRNMDIWDTHIPYACIVSASAAVTDSVIKKGVVVFITADRSVIDKQKSMTIRRMDEDGVITSLSEFMEYKVLQPALDAALHYCRNYGVQLTAESRDSTSE